MERAPTRIALGLAAGGLLGLLAAQPGSGQPPPKQEEHGAKQPGTGPQPAARADAKPPNATLFKNAKVFDGKSGKVTASTSVLVVGNRIKKIGGDIAAPEKGTVIDARGGPPLPGPVGAPPPAGPFRAPPPGGG